MSASSNELTLRRATDQDYEALHEIWMQEDVNPFMFFEVLTKEEFRPIFESLCASSDIYVLEKAGEVVATRRIIFGSGDYAHTAYFASFAVHKDKRERGFGSFFYDVFIEKLKKERSDITRIELTQETDNEPALCLAQKKEFSIETIFPDWLPRLTGTEHYTNAWYIGERFLALVSPEMRAQSQTVAKKFNAVLPSLLSIDVPYLQSNKIKNSFSYSDEIGHLQMTITVTPGIQRYDHILSASFTLEAGNDPTRVKATLRQFVVEQAAFFKKIEVHTKDPILSTLLNELGFHCRGEKIASLYINGQHYNELGTDFGFFGIDHAKELLYKKNTLDDFKRAQLSTLLERCRTAIKEAVLDGKIDPFAKLYLENLAFQITRERLIEAFYDTNSSPWSQLIQAIPSSFSTPWIELGKQLSLTNLVEASSQVTPRVCSR